MVWSQAPQYVLGRLGRSCFRHAPAPSLVVTRTFSGKLEQQKYIPRRMLHGVLPDSLIQDYQFWQVKSILARRHSLGQSSDFAIIVLALVFLRG